MELRHLRYFIAVAEELHFTRAAERLGMAQPPLSQQINLLERELGARLLLRTKRHVELTAAGKAFLEEARKTLVQAERSLNAARSAARGEIGQLAVGFVSSAAFGKFPLIFRRMRERCPGVSLVLRDLTSEEQVEAVKSRELDAGLVRPPVSAAKSLAVEVLWSEPFMAVLPRNHPMAAREQVGLESLAQDSFLLVPRHLGPGYYDQFIRLCAEAGFTPRIVQEVRATPTIVSLVAGGLGVSLVPASLQSLRHAGVVFRPLRPPVPVTDLAVIWRPDDPSPALEIFRQTLRQVAAAQKT